MKKLVKFNFGLRDAFGEAVSVLTEEDMKILTEFTAKEDEVNLGEIEGKHSEVYGPLGSNDWGVISSDQEEIKTFEKLFGNNFGAFNMMEAIAEVVEAEVNG